MWSKTMLKSLPNNETIVAQQRKIHSGDYVVGCYFMQYYSFSGVSWAKRTYLCV